MKSMRILGSSIQRVEFNLCKTVTKYDEDRQCTYKERVRLTTVEVEKQEVLSIMSVYFCAVLSVACLALPYFLISGKIFGKRY
jgi:hypothetical protein